MAGHLLGFAAMWSQGIGEVQLLKLDSASNPLNSLSLTAISDSFYSRRFVPKQG